MVLVVASRSNALAVMPTAVPIAVFLIDGVRGGVGVSYWAGRELVDVADVDRKDRSRERRVARSGSDGNVVRRSGFAVDRSGKR